LCETRNRANIGLATMSDRELAAWIRLTLVPGLGGQTLRRLLGELGLPSQILDAGRAAVGRVIGDPLARRLFDEPNEQTVDRTIAWTQVPGNAIVTLADTAYPRMLLETADPPPLLFLRGDASILARPSLAIVGSRNATPQGLANAESFAHTFSDAGLAIVSGLALGIDAAAHRGGLNGAGSTVAVLGTGADVAYPAKNRALYEAIVARGLVASEFPLGTPAVAANFPRRNRIISGLARGVLVVEAALGSGSLITARLAAEQGRDLFAIPGSIHSPLSKGCHALIKEGAKLVESAADVLSELSIEAHAAPTPAQREDDDHGLLGCMGHDPCNVDTLVARSGLTAEVVSAMLLSLELEGKVASLPGGRYQRIA
jgi:DNA processing protein